MTEISNYEATMARGEAGIAALIAERKPLAPDVLTLIYCLLGFGLVVAAESTILLFALGSSFQATSDGENLGADLSHLVLGVMAFLFMSVLLHDHSATEQSIRGWMKKWRIIPIIAVVIGMGVFVATSVTHATGSDDGIFNLGAWALSFVCGFLFMGSILITNGLVGKLLPALHTISEGVHLRTEIARYRRELDEAANAQGEIEKLNCTIEPREKPNALRARVAAELASIVDQVAAEARNLADAREAYGDTEPRAGEVAPAFADLPASVLLARATRMEGWTYTHFYNLLQKDDAHVS